MTRSTPSTAATGQIQAAFAVADHPPVDVKVIMHRELIGPEAALRTELVSA